MGNQIKQFDKSTCKTVAEVAELALQTVAKQYGLAIKQVGGSYSDGSFKVRYEFSTADATAGVDEATQRTARLLGLPEDVVGKTVTLGRRTFTITGLVSRRPKFPVSARGPKGGRYKLPLQDVKRALGLVQPRNDFSSFEEVSSSGVIEELNPDAPPVPEGMRPKKGVEYGCGKASCRDCYEETWQMVTAGEVIKP